MPYFPHLYEIRYFIFMYTILVKLNFDIFNNFFSISIARSCVFEEITFETDSSCQSWKDFILEQTPEFRLIEYSFNKLWYQIII